MSNTTKGNGKKEKGAKGAVTAVAAAIVAAMVRTMDGLEVQADKAIALARGGLMAYKQAAPNGSKIADMLDGMIVTYDTDGPDAFVFASEESPKAKGLVGVLGGVRVKEGVKLFVPLIEERARREAYLKSRGEKVEAQKVTSEKAAADALAKIEEDAKKKAALTAARVAKDVEGAAFLEGFVNKEAVAAKDADRKRVNDERQKTRALRELRVKPFALGQATVVLDEGRPTHLRATLEDGTPYQVPVVYFQGLQAYGEKILPGMDPKDIPVSCSFCEEDMHLGDMRPIRKEGDTTLPAVWQASFEARTPDGRNVWSFRGGKDNGKPRFQNVLACSWCGSAIRNLSPKKEIPDNRKEGATRSVPSVRTFPLYASYKAWTEGKTAHWTGESTDEVVTEKGTDGVEVETTKPKMATGPAPALTSRPFDASSLGAVAAAVGKGKTE